MIPLKVKGGFHSPFMETAAKAFGEELSGISVKAPEIPVYANRTAAPYPGEGRETEMKELLAGQIISPVQWEQTIRSMIADGADTFVEIGPGETLCGMIKRIDKNVRTFPVEDIKGIKQWRQLYVKGKDRDCDRRFPRNRRRSGAGAGFSGSGCGLSSMRGTRSWRRRSARIAVTGTA